VFTGGIQLVDGFTTLASEHPIIASIGYEATKVVVTGGPAKAVVNKIAKSAFEGAINGLRDQVVGAVQNAVTDFVTDLGIEANLSIAGHGVLLPPEFFGGAAGEVGAGIVDSAVFDGKLKDLTSRGRSIQGNASELIERRKVGPYTVGEYRDVQGHHPHSQAARRGDPNYKPRRALAMLEDGSYDHDKITARQRELYTEFRRNNPNGKLTAEIEDRIEIEALQAGGVSAEHAAEIMRLDRERLIEMGASADPTRLPYTPRGK
jgi:hypothetical protein